MSGVGDKAEGLASTAAFRLEVNSPFPVVVVEEVFRG